MNEVERLQQLVNAEKLQDDEIINVLKKLGNVVNGDIGAKLLAGSKVRISCLTRWTYLPAHLESLKYCITKNKYTNCDRFRQIDIIRQKQGNVFNETGRNIGIYF